ncbi:MAG: tetratricopeptide repeat protein [Acidimicrobiales bacterium]
MATTLARFTPSLLDHKTLERLFVSREPLLGEVLDRIDRAARSPERDHKLWVGPRGAGKTHLVSLVYHRSRQMAGFGTEFQLSWLPEDPWSIDSLDDLLAEILDRLEPSAIERTEHPDDDIVRVAREHGPIVVLVENLDQVLDAIGSDGQRRLRALLENERPILLVATATKLTEYLISQAEPFYGYFDTTTLQPFGVEEAIAMLKAIAALDNNKPVIRRLDEHGARARLAAIKHLAGGQPRVWALLGSGLSIESLGDLVSALLQRFDDLTPYYQEQLARLSRNERKVVRNLAEADRAMTVRDLSTATGISQQSLAKTLTDLRRSGWVSDRSGLFTSMVDQRLRFYQLAEPLVRLAFQLKSSRGEPIKLVLDFLTAWYDRGTLALTTCDNPMGASYLRAALDVSTQEPIVMLCNTLTAAGSKTTSLPVDLSSSRFSPRVLDQHPTLVTAMESLDDALNAYQRGNAMPLLEQPAELSQLVEFRLASGSADRLRIELAEVALGQEVRDPASWISRSEAAVNAAQADEEFNALLVLARWHLRAGQDGPADLIVQRAIGLIQHTSGPGVMSAALRTAEELIRDGHPSQADVILQAIGPIAPLEQQNDIGVARQAVNFRLGQPLESVAQWEEIVQRVSHSLGPEHPANLSTRGNLAIAYQWARRTTESIDSFGLLLEDCIRILGPDHPGTLKTRNNLTISYQLAGLMQEALDMIEHLVNDYQRVLGPDHPDSLAARSNLAVTKHSAGFTDEALFISEQLIRDYDRILGHDHPNTLTARRNLVVSYLSAGRTDDALVIGEQVLTDSERILGPNHPDTMKAHGNLAITYRSVGRAEEALAIEELLVADSERILGPEHPDSIAARSNLIIAFESLGRSDDALVIGEQVLADSERILGTNHPDTLTARGNLAASYQLAGRIDEAIAIDEMLISDCVRILGPDHPNTAAVRNNLATWLRSLGREDEAHAIEAPPGAST